MSTNEPKWTPGPWEVCEDERTGEPAVHAPGAVSHGFMVQMPICDEVGGWRNESPDGSWSNEQAFANANLIAAAPALYQAPKELSDF